MTCEVLIYCQFKLSEQSLDSLLHRPYGFLQRVYALLAMQSAVIARGILSVLCPSVTFRYCDQTNEDTIVWFSAFGRSILLVSEE